MRLTQETAARRLPCGALVLWPVEFAITALPHLISLTLPEVVPVLMAATLAGGLVLNTSHHRQETTKDAIKRSDGLQRNRAPFVAAFRSATMLTTCVCILAVDFHVFPRRFAKVETYGTGIMDIGVGAFVFANGLVSRQARGIRTPDRRSYDGLVGRARGAMHSVGPCLVLGLGRLASVKATEYPEHVSEYGVHWNFFLSLAAVSLLTTVVQPSPVCSVPLAGLMLAAHHYALTRGGLESYIGEPQLHPATATGGTNNAQTCSLSDALSRCARSRCSARGGKLCLSQQRRHLQSPRLLGGVPAWHCAGPLVALTSPNAQRSKRCRH